MNRPTLLQELEQFLYTHAPNMLYKRQMLMLVQKWEDAYQQRIEELEKPALIEQFNRMTDEGSPPKSRECNCAGIARPPCTYCMMTDEEYENYQSEGTRYEF